MVYRPAVDQKLCFVLMPFSKLFNSYYQDVIKPAASSVGLDAVRSDEIYGTKAIVQDIWNQIWQARVVVADVTTKNPNVNYELGLCHALGIPTIIITKTIDDVPFDYRHRRCITYDTDNPGWDDKLRDDLSKTIQVVLADGVVGEELGWPYDTHLLREPTSGSALIASGDSRKVVIRGAQIARKALAATFGPLGQGVAVSKPFGRAIPLRRGTQIVQGIKSANPLEEKGIEEIRSVAHKMQDLSGDGTKLACMLAADLMVKGQELIDKDYHPKKVVQALQSAAEQVQIYLRSQAFQVNGTSLEQVAIAAAHGDKRTAGLVCEALRRVGKDGVITIETVDRSEASLKFQEGLHLDRGFLSDQFITDAGRQECALNNCLVLIHERKIVSMIDLIPILEQVARSGKSLLVLAEDIEGEALATLIVNKLRGTLPCVGVRCPGFGDRRKHLIEDIAVLTGAKALTAERGVALSKATFDDLGKAEKIIVTSNETTLIGGGGSALAIEERARAIRSQIEYTANDTDREKLQERLAMLTGGVAAIRIGGLTEAEGAEERYKTEAALHSARAAIEQGTVPGGGVALYRAGVALEKWEVTGEIELGVRQAMMSTLENPIRQLIENAQRSPTQILSEILKSNSANSGFDITSNKVEDLVERGVIDPVRVLDFAVRIAVSYATAVLQTAAWDMSAPKIDK